ncbi:unnamed protein product [Calypogeia fissa]
MHGRPRLPPGQSPDHAKNEEKGKKLNSLLEDVLRNHHEKCYTKGALKQSAQLLELNPEFYTAWNYRKRAVQHLIGSEPDEDARKRFLEDEMRMVERALQANIKSYGAWHHRRWIIEFGYSSLDHEFVLLKKLLKIDSRNFHGWRHRRFCVTASKVTPDRELQYATEKINENFSNYSAWHYRSTLLSQLVSGGVSKEKILTDEYELVNQAYFTEPDDQSAWFYNTWLLGETKLDSRPRLLGTWPLDGSTVTVEVDTREKTIYVRSKNPVDAWYGFFSEGLPIVLSFSEVITDLVVQVRSTPALLGHLSDVHWPLSSGQGPSKTWIGEFPLQGCPEGEFGLSLKISSQSELCQEMEIKFNLQVSAGKYPYERDSMKKVGLVDWPSSWPGKSFTNDENEERRLRLERGNGEPVPTVTTAVGKVDWQLGLLEEQIQHLRELLELEPNSKWAKLTLSKVLLEQSVRTHDYGKRMNDVLDQLKELTQLDPDHKTYYESQLSSLLIAKVLRSPNDLKQLWAEPQKKIEHSEHPEASGWLRWSGFSLSKFDSVEGLLWVQRLDLSHNQLRCLDGLEAMQLLESLDVSHNLITSVTALAPLRLNPHLRFLNVSHNEIGSHPVDSSRYSFPSVLTNQKLSSLAEGELHHEEIGEEQWEVQVVFGGLKLTVLEVFGNVAASSKSFKEALLKALPSLELLNGEQI